MQKFTVEDFSGGVEAIYDYALDPEKWHSVLPQVAPLLPGEAFAKLYKLTTSELRIALALAPGLQLQDAAGILGISIATVKSHLAKLFAKTGTSRQAELMALMMRATPLTATD